MSWFLWHCKPRYNSRRRAARTRSLSLLVVLLLPVGTRGAEPPKVQIRVTDFQKGTAEGPAPVQDPEAPVSLELPPYWALDAGMRWGDHETTLYFHDMRSRVYISLYYQYPLVNALPDWDTRIERKIQLRRDSFAKDYHVRPGSVQQSVVDGRPALSFIGEFSLGDGTLRSEYILWVDGANGKAEFFMQLPGTADVAAFLSRLDPIVQSFRIPNGVLFRR
jgi:hypothetical protein